MIRLYNGPVTIRNGRPVPEQTNTGRDKSLAYRILNAHNVNPNEGRLSVRFDGMLSHDITYVGILQTAVAAGLTKFPVPYALTNCHNSLCAVGGTINEDDHAFGLSAAKRFGGIYVPANLAVIHQYAREQMAGVGKMILGSDSHTRYGALGTLGVGEGGPELVRQLLGDTYDVPAPQVVLVWLTGAPRKGVGPHDAAIAICGEVYKNGFVKNKIMEFAGPGVKSLPLDFRLSLDCMTTECACLSSVWETDDAVKAYYATHGRAEAFEARSVTEGAAYDAMIEVDLSALEPMAALPFHPSNAVRLRDLIDNPGDVLRQCEKDAFKKSGAVLRLTDKIENGKVRVDQGVIAGCAGGTFDNLTEAAAILKSGNPGSGYFSLSAYPSSMPVNLALTRCGAAADLLSGGAVLKPCFCGPCFGAGDVPVNGGLSIRHSTRNFPNREGSKPGEGQSAAVMLMDARSIAATAANGGVLTSAMDVEYDLPDYGDYVFDPAPYEKRVYNGVGKPDESVALRYGPNIAPWPVQPALPEHLLLRLDSVLRDPVTTTDELIPSGETSSYRSNPLRLAAFTLSRRDPAYVSRTKETKTVGEEIKAGQIPDGLAALLGEEGIAEKDLGVASAIYAVSPGDGSAREQAASCQRVLGGGANFCKSFATKRYRSNCINWGILPLTTDDAFPYETGDWVLLKNIRRSVETGETEIRASVLAKDGTHGLSLKLEGLTDEERQIILDGCLMNYYKRRNAK